MVNFSKEGQSTKTRDYHRENEENYKLKKKKEK